MLGTSPVSSHDADAQAGTLAYNAATRRRLQDLGTLADEAGVPLDQAVVQLVTDTLDRLDALLAEPDPAEQRRRAGMQLAAACRLAFDWRSPALAQAGALAVGTPDALRSGQINYSRYHEPAGEPVERALARQLGVDERFTVLVTGSGMAALSVLLCTLRTSEDPRRVLVTPTVYFEALDALALVGPAEVRRVDSCDAREIAREAVSWGADVVLADPLQNGPEQRVIDVAELARRLRAEAGGCRLIVDGTMVPSAPVLDPRALYYESLGKYRHLGLDLTLAGVVVVPAELAAAARRARQNLGAGLDRYGCELSPLPSGAEVLGRFRRMERAAGIVAAAIEQRRPRGWQVRHPSLPAHPDRALAARLGYTGSCVTITPEPRAEGQERVERLASAALRRAAATGVELTHGESFGFNVSRLSITLEPTTLPPLARVALGPVTDDVAVALGALLAEALAET